MKMGKYCTSLFVCLFVHLFLCFQFCSFISLPDSKRRTSYLPPRWLPPGQEHPRSQADFGQGHGLRHHARRAGLHLAVDVPVESDG